MAWFQFTVDAWDSLRDSADVADYEGVVIGTFLLLFSPFLDVLRLDSAETVRLDQDAQQYTAAIRDFLEGVPLRFTADSAIPNLE